jgi:Holliday junction resolvasome RuvABC endonuclease subunit
VTPSVLGLDLSCSATGIAFPDGLLRTVRPKAGAKDHARRLNEVVFRVHAWIAAAGADVAVIEGYSPGGPSPWTQIRLAELGGAIRVLLFEAGTPYVEVAPASLKLFATGHGRAKKPEMVEACKAEGGEPANDNEADAWHLRQVALAFYSGDPDGRLSPALRALPWPNRVPTGGPR